MCVLHTDICCNIVYYVYIYTYTIPCYTYTAQHDRNQTMPCRAVALLVWQVLRADDLVKHQLDQPVTNRGTSWDTVNKHPLIVKYMIDIMHNNMYIYILIYIQYLSNIMNIMSTS